MKFRIFTPILVLFFVIFSDTRPAKSAGFGEDDPDPRYEQNTIAGIAKSKEYLLQVFAINHTSSLIFALTNIGNSSLSYSFDDKNILGFRFKLFDDKKRPIAFTEEGKGLPEDSLIRLSAPLFSSMPAGEGVGIQVDLKKFFSLPEERPTTVYLSLWWFSGYDQKSQRFSRPKNAIWAKIILN